MWREDRTDSPLFRKDFDSELLEDARKYVYPGDMMQSKKHTIQN